MKNMLIGILLSGSVALGAADLNGKENKWALMDQGIDNFSMIPSKKSDEGFAPPAMIFDLIGKSGSVAVSLCGPKLVVESGADVPSDVLGSLSVEKIEGLGWFGSVSQVVNGRVILRMNTKGEKDLLEKEIKEFQGEYSCNYL